jgi:hypothetical protein
MWDIPYYFIPSKSANKKPLPARMLTEAHYFTRKGLLFSGMVSLFLCTAIHKRRDEFFTA